MTGRNATFRDDENAAQDTVGQEFGESKIVRRKKENTAIAAFQAISNSKERAFLVAFARTARITAASRLSRMQCRNHYNWLLNDAEYSQAFAEAKRMAADFAEDDVLNEPLRGTTSRSFIRGRSEGGSAMKEHCKQGNYSKTR